MRQRAEVIKREGNSYWVKVSNPSKACGKCQGCLRITGENKPEDTVFKLESPKHYRVGDQVIIETETRAMVRALAVLYGFPLLGLFLGYALGFFLRQNDSQAGLGALFGLLFGVFVARPIARKAANSVQDPKIVSRACS